MLLYYVILCYVILHYYVIDENGVGPRFACLPVYIHSHEYEYARMICATEVLRVYGSDEGGESVVMYMWHGQKSINESMHAWMDEGVCVTCRVHM